MGIFGVLEAEELLQVHLPGRAAQQVPAPDHLGDAGFAVIHGDGQLVDIHAVGPPDHEIAAVRQQVLPVGTLNQIGECIFPVGDHDPPAGQPLLGGPLFGGQVPTGARVDVGAVGEMGGVDIVELTAGAVAGKQEVFLP